MDGWEFVGLMTDRQTARQTKGWMVGGMIYLSPSLFVDANAFYFDRDKTVSQIDTPQKGARLGVRLKF